MNAVLIRADGRVTAIRPAVAETAAHQERVLAVHDPKKGGAMGWRTMTPAILLRYLEDEVRELRQAVEAGSPERMQHEAVDVQNFATMIHDVAGELLRVRALSLCIGDDDAPEDGARKEAALEPTAGV